MGRLGGTLAACSLLLMPTAGQTASPPDRTEIEPVLVSPRRIPGLSVDAAQFPGSATVVTAEEIQRSGTTSVPELLARVQGVTVMDTNGFGLGADGSVNLRGIVNSSRTNALVLVDGVRQNRLTGDEVHWQSIPIEDIERIEIIRGGGGLIYGEGALAGLINITTKRSADRPLETENGVELGGFGRRHYHVAARGRSGPLHYGTGYDRRDVGGYRENTQSRTTTVTSHIGVDVLKELRLSADVLHSADTSGFAGGITPDASQARRRQKGSFSGFYDDETTQVSLETLAALPQGVSLVTTAFWRTRESDSDTGGSRFATITPSQGVSLRGAHDLLVNGVRHTLVTGIDLLGEKASTGSRGGSFSESNKASYGLYAEETLRLFDRVSLLAGLRYDRARFEEAIDFPAFVGTLHFRGWSPAAGVTLDVARPLTLYAHYARPFKAPNVDDFSATVPSGFVGNLNLKPQQADDVDVGWRFHHARLGSFESSWFYTRINDEILFNDLPGNDQNQNFDTVRTGVETTVSPVLPLRGLTGTLTYTFVDAAFRKGSFADHTLPGTPKHQLTLGLAYTPITPCTLTLDWRLVRDFFRINDFTNTLPGNDYGVLDLGVRMRIKAATIYFKLENATDEEYTSFQSSDGVTASTGENPAPPRSWVGGVNLRF